MADLTGRIALVTGASRGVGKGIALGLGEAGAIVYVAARTLHSEDPRLLGGSLTDTVAEIARSVALECRCAVTARWMPRFARCSDGSRPSRAGWTSW